MADIMHVVEGNHYTEGDLLKSSLADYLKVVNLGMNPVGQGDQTERDRFEVVN